LIYVLVGIVLLVVVGALCLWSQTSAQRAIDSKPDAMRNMLLAEALRELDEIDVTVLAVKAPPPKRRTTVDPRAMSAHDYAQHRKRFARKWMYNPDAFDPAVIDRLAQDDWDHFHSTLGQKELAS
jgi:hypothetical protein